MICRTGPHARESSGVVGITFAFLFTGVGHFVKTDAMVQMVPPFIPAPTTAVVVSGIVELAAAGAILIPKWRRGTGILLLVLLVSFLPVNIYAAIQRVPMGAHSWGPIYLMIRIPLQIVIIAWVYFFSVRLKTK